MSDYIEFGFSLMQNLELFFKQATAAKVIFGLIE